MAARSKICFITEIENLFISFPTCCPSQPGTVSLCVITTQNKINPCFNAHHLFITHKEPGSFGWNHYLQQSQEAPDIW